MRVIVYKSQTGFTKDYAMLLSAETLYPAYSLEEARIRVTRNDEVIFLGWLMAGKIMGLTKARKRYRLLAVAGIGMAFPSQISTTDLINHNALTGVNTFYLQGGLDFSRLKGIYRFMMGFMRNMLAKKQAELSDEERLALEMFSRRTDHVDAANLKPLIASLDK